MTHSCSLLTALVLALVSTPASSASAQESATAAPLMPDACEAKVGEIIAAETRMQALQARLTSRVQGVEQNARSGQAVASGANVLGWASALASFVPGVGFAASAAGAAATVQALRGQQAATANVNADLQDVVTELTSTGQGVQRLRQEAAAQGCAVPPPLEPQGG